MESIGGLAGLGWAKTSGGVGGPLSPDLCSHLGSSSWDRTLTRLRSVPNALLFILALAGGAKL
eukprot:1157758-Pelagomonas_calceolata.AAC.5